MGVLLPSPAFCLHSGSVPGSRGTIVWSWQNPALSAVSLHWAMMAAICIIR